MSAARCRTGEQGHLFPLSNELLATLEAPSRWAVDAVGAPRWLANLQNADLGEWVPLVPPPLDELPVPSRVREIFADPFTGLAPGAMPSLFRVTVGLHYRAGKPRPSTIRASSS